MSELLSLFLWSTENKLIIIDYYILYYIIFSRTHAHTHTHTLNIPGLDFAVFVSASFSHNILMVLSDISSPTFFSRSSKLTNKKVLKY